jgi:hypothetical protein
MEDFVLVGGNAYKKTPGQVEIANSGEWILVRSTQSLCGRWQNYKLYRDRKSAPKKVFYLSFDRVSNEMQNSHDAVVLLEHYDGMADWVVKSVAGRIVAAPTFPARNGRKKRAAAADHLLNDQQLVAHIVKTVGEWWNKGTPLSPYPQTRSLGRYAPQVIGQKSKARQKDLDELVWALVDDGVLEFVTFNQRMKTKGLRVAKQMEINNG